MPIQVFSNCQYKSLPILPPITFPDLTVLTGENGVGKTHLLRGLAEGIIQAADENSNTIKPTQILSSILAGHITLEFKQNSIDHSIRTAKEERGKGKGHHQQNTQTSKALTTMSEMLSKPIEDLTDEDIEYNYLYSLLAEKSDPRNLTAINLAGAIRAYQARLYYNDWCEFRSTKTTSAQYLAPDEFTHLHGPPPWQLADAVMAEFGFSLDYGNTNLDERNPRGDITIQLRNTRGTPVNLQDLSSGECLMLGLSASLYSGIGRSTFPKLLLLDEVDSALHPSWMIRFLQVLEEKFIADNAMRIIIATHSPSMVALAPATSVHLITREDPRIAPVSKDEAIGRLTRGVPSLRLSHKNRCQVFTESKFDAEIFSMFYRHLQGLMDHSVSLSFIEVGHETGGGCDRVMDMTQQFRQAGNDRIFGIIDHDGTRQEQEGDGIIVLGRGERYSIENFLLDPLLLAGLLLDIAPQRYADIFNVRSYTDLRMADPAEISISVAKLLHQHQETVSGETKAVKTVEGRYYSVPSWVLSTRGHDLASTMLDIFPEIKRARGLVAKPGQSAEHAVMFRISGKIAADFVELIPMGVLDTFRRIQQFATL